MKKNAPCYGCQERRKAEKLIEDLTDQLGE